MLTKKWLFCAVLAGCILLTSCTGGSDHPDQTDSNGMETHMTVDTSGSTSDPSGRDPEHTSGTPSPSDPDFPVSVADPEVVNDGNWTPFY